MTRNQSGRVQAITQLPALPATCAMCGKPPGRVGGREVEFADFGLSYEFYGAFYLCDECVWEIADVMGCASPLITAKMNEEKAQSVERIAELEKELEETKRVLASSMFDWSKRNSTNPAPNVVTVKDAFARQ